MVVVLECKCLLASDKTSHMLKWCFCVRIWRSARVTVHSHSAFQYPRIVSQNPYPAVLQSRPCRPSNQALPSPQHNANSLIVTRAAAAAGAVELSAAFAEQPPAGLSEAASAPGARCVSRFTVSWQYACDVARCDSRSMAFRQCNYPVGGRRKLQTGGDSGEPRAA